jgi:2-hydroxy-3-oxopropionate reductase
MTEQKVGFIGLGLIGSRMTSNLLSAGHSVIGYDIDESRVDHLIKKGSEDGSSSEPLAQDPSVHIP